MVIRHAKLNLITLIQQHPMENSAIKTDSHKSLTPAMEDYLEAIFNLSREKRVVRVKDIAKRLGVKMPTVTSMLKTLSERGLVDYEKYEYLELTQKGSAVGEEIDRRHHVLRSFLTDILKIDLEKADEEACKMEHAISSSTLERFIEFMEFIQFCPRVGLDWLEYFDEYRLHGQERDKCLARMKKFANGFRVRIKSIEEVEAEK